MEDPPLPTTNNAAESFHSELKGLIGGRPSQARAPVFIEKLKNLINTREGRISQYKHGITTYTTKDISVRKALRIKTIME